MKLDKCFWLCLIPLLTIFFTFVGLIIHNPKWVGYIAVGGLIGLVIMVVLLVITSIADEMANYCRKRGK